MSLITIVSTNVIFTDIRPYTNGKVIAKGDTRIFSRKWSPNKKLHCFDLELNLYTLYKLSGEVGLDIYYPCTFDYYVYRRLSYFQEPKVEIKEWADKKNHKRVFKGI